MYRSNLKHVLLCTQAVARRMVADGHGGSMISVASIEGVRAAPLYAAYAAAKAGVINLTKTLSLELAPHRIRVNAIAPDITWTEGLEAMGPGRDASRGPDRADGPRRPRRRVRRAAVFLASELASYVTGQTLHVDGGTSASMGWYHHPEDGRYVYGPVSGAPAAPNA